MGMMMKYVKAPVIGAVLVVAAAVAPYSVGAQQTQPAGRSLSIEEALRMATATSEQVAVASAGVTRARGQQMQAKSQYFPQLNGFVNYSRALASEFADVFGGSDTTTTAEPDTTSGGGIDFSNLPFGRKNTYTFGLSLQQNLFTGGRIKAQNRVADASRRTAEITLSSAQAQVTLDVAQAYYDAALAQRLYDIADASLAQSERALAQAKLSRQVGNQSEFELLRAQVTRDNQVPVVIQQRSARDLALLRLKQLLDIPADQQVTLTSELLGDTLAPIPGFAPMVSTAAAAASMDSMTRAPVRQAAEGLQIQNATLDIAQSQRYPAISLTSNYARVNYPSDMLPQFNDLRTNWTAGLSLQLPLFTGGRLKGDRVVAEANVSQARAQLRQTQELAALDTRSTYEQLMAADAAWQASSGTVTQAQRAYDIAELRYREGISTQLELNDARLLLQQAQANRARSARDLQVARIRVVLLPDLPLGAGTAGGSFGGQSGASAPGGGGSGAYGGAAGAGAGGAGTAGGSGGAAGAGSMGGGAGMQQGGGLGGGIR